MHHFLSSLSSRSLGMTLGNTSWLKQMYIDALKDGSSVVAVDKEGKLMGVRVGKVTRCSRDGRPSLYQSSLPLRRADWGAWFEDRMTAAAASLSFLLPKVVEYNAGCRNWSQTSCWVGWYLWNHVFFLETENIDELHGSCLVGLQALQDSLRTALWGARENIINILVRLQSFQHRDVYCTMTRQEGTSSSSILRWCTTTRRSAQQGGAEWRDLAPSLSGDPSRILWGSGKQCNDVWILSEVEIFLQDFFSSIDKKYNADDKNGIWWN